MPLKSRDETRNLQFRLHVDSPNQWDTARIQAAVLMDIRDELQKLNALLHCHNFTGIPTTLRSIRRAMPVRRRKGKRHG